MESKLIINDDYVFTFGGFKGYKICNCNKEYLINFFYANKNRKDNNNEVQCIVDFIKEKYKGDLYPSLKNKPREKQRTKKEQKFEKTISSEPKIYRNAVQILCKKSKKIIFLTKSDCTFELKRIRENNQKNEYKPIRTYECEHCGGWHLTSKEYKKIFTQKKIEAFNGSKFKQQ